ncbi:Detected protein of unknown function [Hibiscus syriacus]|uniref:Dof zinc finger protein n=1 Tax=Hibiscus syriacus TaxID=106335 RepID=A0A6A3AC47_HIBSY|nr:Detected protein of unknown function [Hibiscus syriacus]
MKHNQQQNQRLKASTGDNQQQHQNPPQKCPRCVSLNTKFCYYNNYSLSQPRYFCKTCKRYWTQGGTLRNVPVGGGCRKGKRTKVSPSGENSSPIYRYLSSKLDIIANGSYYPGAGFLSSLAAVQSMNQPQPFNQPLSQALSIGGDLGGSSNLGLLQGYGSRLLGHNSPSQFFKPNSFLWVTEIKGLFVNNSNPTVSELAVWSINNSSSSTSNPGNINTNTTGSSLNPNQWTDLPGYGTPP